MAKLSTYGDATALARNAEIFGRDPANANKNFPGALFYGVTDLAYFGDGSDGDVTISGSVTLTRDMFYNNLTIGSGAALDTDGYKIFVKGVLDLTAAPAGGIQRSPNSGSRGGRVAGAIAAAIATGSVGGSIASAAGGAGATTNGAQGGTVTLTSIQVNGGKAGNGIAGGNSGTGNTGWTAK